MEDYRLIIDFSFQSYLTADTILSVVRKSLEAREDIMPHKISIMYGSDEEVD